MRDDDDIDILILIVAFIAGFIVVQAVFKAVMAVM